MLVFFFIVFGLMLGHLLRRALGSVRSAATMTWVGHLKGLAVLAATVAAMVLVLSGSVRSGGRLALAVTCAIISFYFGSRS